MNCEGNCKGQDPEIWFDPASVELAVAICEGCPLQRACAKRGASEEFGVWGGVSPIDRALSRWAKLSSELRKQRQIEFVLLLSELGMKMPQIAKALGTDYHRVKNVKYRSNHRKSEHDRYRDIAAAAAHATRAKVQQKFGIDVRTYFRALAYVRDNPQEATDAA